MSLLLRGWLKAVFEVSKSQTGDRWLVVVVSFAASEGFRLELLHGHSPTPVVSSRQAVHPPNRAVGLPYHASLDRFLSDKTRMFSVR